MKLVMVIFTICALLLSISFSCKKKKDSVKGGGKGGNAMIKAVPQHGGIFVDSAMVYIKYGTLDAPANGIFDDSTKIIMEDTTPVAIFSGLTIGNYFLVGIGYHLVPLIGGSPWTIKNENTIDSSQLQLGPE